MQQTHQYEVMLNVGHFEVFFFILHAHFLFSNEGTEKKRQRLEYPHVQFTVTPPDFGNFYSFVGRTILSVKRALTNFGRRPC